MGGIRRSAIVALGTAAALAVSVVASSPAMAASSPIEACGGGSYHVIDSKAFGTSATVYLLYNGSTNCVVTWKQGSAVGNSVWVRAVVQAYGSPGVVDANYYRYYAGPVKVKAPGKCIMWGGSYGDQWYESPFEHCG
ncbi:MULTISPECIES: hypothetical protein [Nonomuraea]|uniref:Spore-associated protein A n=1 Tax=Nonomuraea mangrovi TaxID=2316207 RepID=A0ABW4STN5_9ACTN